MFQSDDRKSVDIQVHRVPLVFHVEIATQCLLFRYCVSTVNIYWIFKKKVCATKLLHKAGGPGKKNKRLTLVSYWVWNSD